MLNLINNAKTKKKINSCQKIAQVSATVYGISIIYGLSIMIIISKSSQELLKDVKNSNFKHFKYWIGLQYTALAKFCISDSDTLWQFMQ